MKEDVLSELDLLDEQLESAAIVLGRGVDEAKLDGNILPNIASFIAAGVTGTVYRRT